VKTELLPVEPADRFHPAARRGTIVRPKEKTSPLAQLPRLAGYAVMAFIAWLLISTLLKPWISTGATRAILDAPAVLMTTPIEGTVTALNAQNGQAIQPGQTIAVVKNATVAQDTLTTLLTRRLELQSRAQDLKNRLQTDRHMLDYTSSQYQQYHDATLGQLRASNASLHSDEDSASSTLTGLSTKYWHSVALQRDGAVSAATVSAARAEMDAAQSKVDSIRQDTQRHSAAIGAAERGVYVSSSQDGNGLLPQLSQRRADLQNGIRNELAESDALTGQLADLDKLIGAEHNRVQTLSEHTITAFAPAVVHEIVAPVGTQVTAGATLVRATDCSKTSVVAVFPAHMASRLTSGSELKVQLNEVGGTFRAHVTQLLPSAPESMQNDYSAPFPYAEAGSVYALATLDADTSGNPSAATCTPGRSVTANLL
jgi:biotin carboxyl carrier protein